MKNKVRAVLLTFIMSMNMEIHSMAGKVVREVTIGTAIGTGVVIALWGGHTLINSREWYKFVNYELPEYKRKIKNLFNEKKSVYVQDDSLLSQNLLLSQNPLSPLTAEIEQEIKKGFSERGFKVKIKNDLKVTAAIPSSNGGILVGIGELERSVLMHDRLDVCCGTTRTFLETKHIKAVLFGHELDHLMHQDSKVFASKAEEMMELILKNPGDKELFRALMLSYANYRRECEERCDRNAAYNLAGKDADPEILAQHAEDLAHYCSFISRKEERCMPLLESKARELNMTVEEMLEHPLCSVRVAYLQELAAQFRRQKTLSFKVAAWPKQQWEEFRKLVRGQVKPQSDFPPLKMTRSFEKHS
jgi:hypothetical protein